MKKNVRNCIKDFTPEDVDSLEKYLEKYNKCKNMFYSMYYNKLDKIYLKDNSIRDEIVKNIKNMELPQEQQNLLSNVPSKLWKCALNEVMSNNKSNWSNLKFEIKKIIARNKNLKKNEKHYLHYVLKSNLILNNVRRENNHVIEKFKDLDIIQLNKYLNRIIRTKKFKKPTSKARSFLLESVQYRYKTENGNHYILLSTLEKGKRLKLKLSHGIKFYGAIRIVIKNNRIEIHKAIEVKEKPCTGTNVVGVDKGYTSLIATSSGNIYGDNFSKLIKDKSDKLLDKIQKNRKLKDMAEKRRKNGNRVKANNIIKNNLGKKKYLSSKKKYQSKIESFVNDSINEFIKTENPRKIVCEELTFQKNNKKYKKTTKRYLSLWQKGYLQKRFNYKCDFNGIELILVNAAYTSKVCSHCGCFGKRNGASFNCKNCGLSINADINAAENIRNRMFDGGISLHTYYKDVGEIIKRRQEENHYGYTDSAKTPAINGERSVFQKEQRENASGI